MKFMAVSIFTLLLTGALLIPTLISAQETNQTNGGTESVGITDEVSVNKITNGTATESIPLEDEVSVTESTETTSEDVGSEQDISALIHEAVLLFKQQREETINAIKECRENIQNASPENRQQARDDCKTNLNEIKEFYKEIRNQIRELFKENRETTKILIKEAKISLGEKKMIPQESEDVDESEEE